MRFARTSFWLLTFLIMGFWILTLFTIGVLGVFVYKSHEQTETLNSQLADAHGQIESFRAANTSYVSDRTAAARERERAAALELELAHAREEIEQLKAPVIIADSEQPDTDPEIAPPLKAELNAAYEQLNVLNGKTSGDVAHSTSLGQERARAEALTRELAEIRDEVQRLKAAPLARDTDALEEQRARADNLTRELAVRQELEDLKGRNSVTVATLERNLRSARQQLQLLKRKGEAGPNPQQSAASTPGEETGTVDHEPSITGRKSRPNESARSNETGQSNKPFSSRNGRRSASAPEADFAGVSSVQRRRSSSANPSKLKEQALPEDLRPVW
jgi:hypothetical protein